MVDKPFTTAPALSQWGEGRASSSILRTLGNCSARSGVQEPRCGLKLGSSLFKLEAAMGNPTPIKPMEQHRACRSRLYRATPRHRTAPVVGSGATNLLLVTFLISVSAILLGTLILGEALEPKHFASMAWRLSSDWPLSVVGRSLSSAEAVLPRWSQSAPRDWTPVRASQERTSP
jgi:hypothetical protein